MPSTLAHEYFRECVLHTVDLTLIILFCHMCVIPNVWRQTLPRRLVEVILAGESFGILWRYRHTISYHDTIKGSLSLSLIYIYINTEGIVMGGGFLIHRFFNDFLVKEHEKPAEDQKKQETIF